MRPLFWAKWANGEAQQALVKEGQEILRSVGIDPILGEENLVWAPNAVEGQHDIEALEKVVETLLTVQPNGYDDVKAALEDLGQIAAQRR